ncbi:1,2-phenylacetyl-CoA epoxidase subunit PaaC [Sphingomonas bacterium]|uniref:1,2-phenylacetyl-CoA epoxidase subunit PaaC n=1 Tax=Sphingomonas bacterium TaxID=1895847 RepID=UPI00261756D2|nr:1,2-phenylacetyl-CoA epoxidase subunit PaaC [Sphingomonas bacterium]MDB5677935.1 phenylacetate-CoA oxygenase, PaaI subunit [Sphingomonas bacterium]
MNEPLFHALLELADDSLILGQRLCEWSGHAPTVEVDLSLSNLALDLIGQATLFLAYAGEVEGKGRDADRLAFHRDADQFHNCLLVEQPNGDFGQTMARQFLFSTYQLTLFDKLQHSTDRQIAAISAKAVKEVTYHADLAAEWIIRLGDGTDESKARMVEGFDWFWRFVDDMFAAGEGQADLIAACVLVDRASLRAGFDSRVADVLALAELHATPARLWPTIGGREGRHTEHLSALLALMQVLPRAHPEAIW